MSPFEIGKIEGFPDVGIGIPYDLFGMTYDWVEVGMCPVQDLNLNVFCPKFEDEQTITSFRYALSGALSKSLGLIHGFQVQLLESKPARGRKHLGFNHSFAITRTGLISPDVENEFIDLKKNEDKTVELNFKSPTYKINQSLLTECTNIIGPLKQGGWRELRWRYDKENEFYTGNLKGVALEV